MEVKLSTLTFKVETLMSHKTSPSPLTMERASSFNADSIPSQKLSTSKTEVSSIMFSESSTSDRKHPAYI
jgi:hypothetical protein